MQCSDSIAMVIWRNWNGGMRRGAGLTVSLHADQRALDGLLLGFLWLFCCIFVCLFVCLLPNLAMCLQS